jgi:hypothetical protein
MGLTEAKRLRLEGKGFSDLFSDHKALWTKTAEGARELIAKQIEQREPTIDDIRKTLLPLVEIQPKLLEYLATKRLTQKYWIGDFTDYILQEVYKPKLEKPKKG